MREVTYRNDMRLACVQIYLSIFLGFYFLLVTSYNQHSLLGNIGLAAIASGFAFVTTWAIFLFFRDKNVRRITLRVVDWMIGKF